MWILLRFLHARNPRGDPELDEELGPRQDHQGGQRQNLRLQFRSIQLILFGWEQLWSYDWELSVCKLSSLICFSVIY